MGSDQVEVYYSLSLECEFECTIHRLNMLHDIATMCMMKKLNWPNTRSFLNRTEARPSRRHQMPFPGQAEADLATGRFVGKPLDLLFPKIEMLTRLAFGTNPHSRHYTASCQSQNPLKVINSGDRKLKNKFAFPSANTPTLPVRQRQRLAEKSARKTKPGRVSRERRAIHVRVVNKQLAIFQPRHSDEPGI